jgi:hypothetical protein
MGLCLRSIICEASPIVHARTAIGMDDPSGEREVRLT